MPRKKKPPPDEAAAKANHLRRLLQASAVSSASSSLLAPDAAAERQDDAPQGISLASSAALPAPALARTHARAKSGRGSAAEPEDAAETAAGKARGRGLLGKGKPGKVRKARSAAEPEDAAEPAAGNARGRGSRGRGKPGKVREARGCVGGSAAEPEDAEPAAGKARGRGRKRGSAEKLEDAAEPQAKPKAKPQAKPKAKDRATKAKAKPKVATSHGDTPAISEQQLVLDDPLSRLIGELLDTTWDDVHVPSSAEVPHQADEGADHHGGADHRRLTTVYTVDDIFAPFTPEQPTDAPPEVHQADEEASGRCGNFESEADTLLGGAEAELPDSQVEEEEEEEEEEEQAAADNNDQKFNVEYVEWPMLETFPVLAVTAGTVLRECARIHFQYMPRTLKEFADTFLCKMPSRVRCGSMCSGSAMDQACLSAIGKELASLGITVEFEAVFCAEIDKNKRQWLMHHHQVWGEKECHVFEDVGHVADGGGTCSSHSKPGATVSCNSPEVDILCAGTSCKDFSRMNKSMRGSAATLLSQNAAGAGSSTSFHTYQAAKQYIRKYRPKIVFLENSEGILDKPKVSDQEAKEVRSNVDVVLGDLIESGYQAQAIVVDSNKWGCCQRRVRFWVVALLADCAWWRMTTDEEYDAFFKMFVERVKATKIDAPDFRDCMLSDSSHYLQGEYKRHVDKASERTDAGPAVAEKWVKEHQTWCTANKVRWPPEIKETTLASKWFATLSGREKGVIGILQHAHGAHTTIDLAQGIGVPRIVPEESGELGTFLANTRWFVCGDALTPRPLTGLEQLQMQGFPISESDAIKMKQELKLQGHLAFDSLLQSLAGNAFTGHVAVTLFCSVFLCIEWQTPCELEEEVVLQDVMALLRS